MNGTIDEWIDVNLRAKKLTQEREKCAVTLTFAQSLDGSIAAKRGQALTLSSPEAFQMTHKLRAVHEAILVGIETLIADNPSLTTRLVDGQSPIPVIVDSTLRTPLSSKLFVDPRCKRPIIATIEKEFRTDEYRSRETALKDKGATILNCKEDGNGKVLLQDIFKKLYKNFGISSLMVEGGASIITSMLEPNCSVDIDFIVLTVAPMFVGGLNYIEHLFPPKSSSSDSIQYDKWRIRFCSTLGNDIVVCLTHSQNNT